MIGKIRSEMISRRRVFSILGLPVALGLAAAPTSGAEAQEPRTSRQQPLQGRPTNSQAQRSEQHSAPGRRKLAVALQGGGSHGAFTWGVLGTTPQSTSSA